MLHLFLCCLEIIVSFLIAWRPQTMNPVKAGMESSASLVIPTSCLQPQEDLNPELQENAVCNNGWEHLAWLQPQPLLMTH